MKIKNWFNKIWSYDKFDILNFLKQKILLVNTYIFIYFKKFNVYGLIINRVKKIHLYIFNIFEKNIYKWKNNLTTIKNFFDVKKSNREVFPEDYDTNKKKGLSIGNLYLEDFKNYEEFSEAVREAFKKKRKEAWLSEEWIKYNLKRKQKHKWHIVAPSPWPILLSWSILILTIGLISWFYRIDSYTLLIGFFLTLTTISFWFRDVIREATYMGYHTLGVQNNLRVAFSLFITSEVMFFFSFFWAYFYISTAPNIFIGCTWPPEGICNTFVWLNLNQPIYFEDNSLIGDYDNFIYKDIYRNFFLNLPTKVPVNFSSVFHSYIYNVPYILYKKGEFYEKLFDLEKNITPYLRILMLLAYKNGDINCTYNDLLTLKTSIHSNDENAQKFIKENNFNFDVFLHKLYKTVSFDENSFKNKSYKPHFYAIIYSEGVLINPLSIPLVNTILLLSSGCSITACHKYLKSRRYFYSICSLGFTIFLGFLFLVCQYFEYGHAQFSINDGIYGSLFFLLTGFHGVHVIVGVIFLSVCLIRFIRQHFTPIRHLGLEFAIWYWHSVDVVRLILYYAVYFSPNSYYFSPYHIMCYSDYTFVAALNIKNFPDTLNSKNFLYHIAKYNWWITRDILENVLDNNLVKKSFLESQIKILKHNSLLTQEIFGLGPQHSLSENTEIGFDKNRTDTRVLGYLQNGILKPTSNLWWLDCECFNVIYNIRLECYNLLSIIETETNNLKEFNKNNFPIYNYIVQTLGDLKLDKPYIDKKNIDFSKIFLSPKLYENVLNVVDGIISTSNEKDPILLLGEPKYIYFETSPNDACTHLFNYTLEKENYPLNSRNELSAKNSILFFENDPSLKNLMDFEDKEFFDKMITENKIENNENSALISKFFSLLYRPNLEDIVSKQMFVTNDYDYYFKNNWLNFVQRFNTGKHSFPFRTIFYDSVHEVPNFNNIINVTEYIKLAKMEYGIFYGDKIPNVFFNGLDLIAPNFVEPIKWDLRFIGHHYLLEIKDKLEIKKGLVFDYNLEPSKRIIRKIIMKKTND